MRIPGFVTSLAIAIAFSIGGSASGNLVTYSDLGQWQASVLGVSTVTTPDVADDPYYVAFGQGTANYSYGGLVFSTSSTISDSYFYNIGTGWSTSSEAVLSSQYANTGLENILISFGSGIQGIAFNYGTFYGHDVTFTLSNGDFVTQKKPTADGTYDIPNFIGITDFNSFSSVLVTTSDTALNINNFSMAAVALPEPSTFALLGLGGVCLGFRFFRRRQNSK